MCSGGGPIRSGQNSRTRSRLAPIPPEATTTAPASISKSPATSRLDGAPRSAVLGARTSPLAPVTRPSVTTRSVTRWRKRKSTARFARAALERRDGAGAGAPDDVEARDRVAGASGEAAAALRPPDDGEEAHALRMQPRALLASGPVHVGLGPGARPAVLVAVEAGRALPVLPREVARVPDAHAALLGRVHEEQAAERPPRLPAEVLLALLVQDRHAAPGASGLGGGDEPGQPAADDENVGTVGHASGGT